jgi:hypothetical protein
LQHCIIWARIATSLLAAVSALVAQEAPKIEPGSLTIEEVVRESQAGLSDELIIAQVKRNTKAFDLNSDEIVALKKDGVSDLVIKYLLDPSLPPPVPPSVPATGAAPVRAPPSDLLVLKVPPEPGIYYLVEKDSFVALELKPIVPTKEPGKLSSLLKLKGHVIGSMIGLKAKTRIGPGSAVFYARLGEKPAMDDLALLILERERDRRDLDFGAKAGKPVFPMKSVRQFDFKQVDPGMYRITVPPAGKGEYVFIILGSGDERKGLLGKGYDFGTD